VCRRRDQLIANMKTALPQVKDAFWVEFRKELSAEELIKLIIPLYDKHLTHPEIKELIKFYETPVGKKMIAVMQPLPQRACRPVSSGVWTSRCGPSARSKRSKRERSSQTNRERLGESARDRDS
jgi:hypothetical protein